MFFYISRHQRKERAYYKALRSRGYRSHGWQKAEFALFDHDVGKRGVGHRQELDVLYLNDARVFMYPHSARPPLTWDMRDPWPHTTACFVIADGHKNVMERYGYPFPVEVTGWTFCPVLPFQPCSKKIPRVLFAPIHAEQNGFMRESAVEANQSVHASLLELSKSGEIDLVVRHIGPLSLSRLQAGPLAEYTRGEPDGSCCDIDKADVVIANQTYAYLAIARGKPTVMFLDTERPRSGSSNSGMVYARSWEKYEDYMRYPINAEDGDILGAVRRACVYNSAVEFWKRRFIGEQFDPDCFVDRLERYL